MLARHYTLTTSDADRWRRVLPASVSVTGSVEYLRVCERQTGCEARLFVAEGSAPIAAYPYIVRPVGSLPFVAPDRARYADINSPEYRGPLALPGARPEELDALDFAALFSQHCQEEGIIAEFSHLNPWNGAQSMVVPECVNMDREIVYVDLTQTEEEIWTRSLSSDARRQTRQGHRAGVTVRRATSADDVREFHRLHEETMRRRQALDRYFHSAEFFLTFFETMPDNAFFVLAEYGGRAVAGGLFLQDDADIYWHLSAADMEFSQVRPVNVYVHQTILDSLGSGRRRLIMGGAYGKEDGIFRFKTNFSPLRARFCTYKRVHDQATYDALAAEWERHFGQALADDGYFPTYRAVPPVQECEAR